MNWWTDSDDYDSPRTMDTGELAPYPNMTSEDLRDFEAWTDEAEGQNNPWSLLIIIGIVAFWIGWGIA